MQGRLSSALNALICISIFILLCSSVMASGTTGFHFLNMNIGSRAQGMGNAFTAVSPDVNSIYFNPAGGAFATQPAMMLYHSQWIEDISIENLSLVYPLSQSWTVTGGASYLHLPDLEGYDVDPSSGTPIKTGAFQIYDFIAQAGICRRFSRNFAVGAQVKYLQERLDDIVASGFAIDFGAQFDTPIRFLSVGAAIQNLGPRLKYEANAEKLPLTYRLGLAYQLPYNPVIFSVDGVKKPDEKVHLYSGVEFELLNSLAIRSGYDFENDIGAGYSIGVGLRLLNNYKFNYVFSPYGILGNAHRAEIVINFGHNVRNQAKGKPDNEQAAKFMAISYASLDKTSSYSDRGQADPFIPVNLQVRRGEDGVILSWEPTEGEGVKYNVYVRIPSKTGIVKVNNLPLKIPRYLFNPKNETPEIEFFVTSLHQGKESNMSNPLHVKF
jgi:hypothetical protein